MQKSREERRLKLVDWERRAEINTRKLEEKERRRAEEKELQPSGDDDYVTIRLFSADTPLFSCQCSKGKEREVVCDVMAKCGCTHPNKIIL